MALDLTDIASRIEANPLGRLMYGQRELFHSNLLAWFFDVLPDPADAVFRPLALDGSDSWRGVERERENLDLVLHWRDRSPVVIENKVFSVPRKEQLEEYSDKVARWAQAPMKVLLAPSGPDFDLDDWKFMSYGELSSRILASLPNGDTSYNAETMRHYATLANHLHELVGAIDIHSEDETVWLSEHVLSAISSSQMRPALHKARAARVAAYLSRALAPTDRAVGYNLTNAVPLVDWYGEARVAGLHVYIGWQLQGVQFRRAVIYVDPHLDSKSDQALQLREQASREHPEFFVFPGELPIRPSTRKRKEFNHYKPSFVYQWVATPGITVAQLLGAAREIQRNVGDLAA